MHMFARVLAVAILAAGFVPELACAQTPTDAAMKPNLPAKACPTIPNPNALLAIAQDCSGHPEREANCRAYARDEDAEYVIVKDCSPNKPKGYLIIPVKPVTGIEDSQVFLPALADLWEDAWLWARKYPGQPPARTGLAVNSKSGRSQNQLHIHISCVLPRVTEALEAAAVPFYPAKAVTIALGPDKNTYKAIKVQSLTNENNPFRIVQAISGAMNDMKDQSIAVIGSQNSHEYYILDTVAKGINRGHAEELLDQSCALP